MEGRTCRGHGAARLRPRWSGPAPCSSGAGPAPPSGRRPATEAGPAAVSTARKGQRGSRRHEQDELRVPGRAGQIARDKGISVETLLDALANALVAAYKRRPDAAEEAVVTIDPESGEIRVYGQELDEDGNVIREWDDTPDDFGRIAAQTAKQVILQRIREVERDIKYEEYAGREGDIVTGIVQQTDNRYTLLDLGKVEALLPQAEQVPYERYEHGARLKAYIVEVRKTTKGPQIVVSRTHPGLSSGCSSSRCPRSPPAWSRSRPRPASPATAPRSPSGRTTPTSTRSGPASGRVARGCAWSPTSCAASGSTSCRSPTTRWSSIQAALQPARVREVRLDDETGTATVVVSDYQLSLAIGKEGQNARLAARPHRLADRHQERDPAGRRGGRLRGEEWAEGEWVENEAGEMVWKPAEGGEAISADEWSTPPHGRRRRRRPADGEDDAAAAGRGRPIDGTRRPAPDAAEERTGRCRPEGDAPATAARPAGRRRGDAEEQAHSAPLRTCVGCRRRRRPTGWSGSPAARRELAVGRPARARGLAVPGSTGVLERAERRRAFERALRAPVAPEAVPPRERWAS